MNFPRITSKEIIVFPLIERLDQVNEAEKVFEEWIKGAFNDGGPKARDIYIFQECMKPWFHELYNHEGLNKDNLIKLYGNFLRSTIIDSAKNEFTIREHLKDYDNIFSKIKFYLRILPLSWSQSGTDGIVIKFGKLMGPEYEQKVRHALSKTAKFDNLGNLVR